MKILLYADVHMCPRASIINKWGTKYPIRLENCIASVNWLEKLAKEKNCDYIVGLGDFFDKPDLSSDTITACTEIKWSDIEHYSLVGNHDASTSSLMLNSANSLLSDSHKIIYEPFMLPTQDCVLCFLPYVVECDRKPLREYFPKLDDYNLPKIILSHNDICGVQMGPVISKTGFSIEEIEDTCDLFINGHLHNGQAITDKIINLGNLTGKDFGEDAFKHSHSVMILDTETLKISYVENPYAFNFYKLYIDTAKDADTITTLKNNAAVSIKCDATLLEAVKHALDAASDKIVASRIILNAVTGKEFSEEPLDFSVDHLARFIECCKSNIEHSQLLEEEIAEICK